MYAVLIQCCLSCHQVKIESIIVQVMLIYDAAERSLSNLMAMQTGPR